MKKFKRDKWFGLNLADPRLVSGDEGERGFYEAHWIENIKLLPNGMRTRKGRTRIYELAAGKVHSLSWWTDYQNIEYLVLGQGGDIYLDQSAGGTGITTPSKTGLTSTNLSLLGFNKHLWAVNGTDDNIKFDGTSWYRIGIAESAAPTVAINAAVGLLNGTYIYTIQYVRTDATIASFP